MGSGFTPTARSKSIAQAPIPSGELPGACCAHRLELRLEERGPFGEFAAVAFGGSLGLGSALLGVVDALDPLRALALHTVDEPLPRPLQSGQPRELSERRRRPLPRLCAAIAFTNSTA